MKIIMSAKYLKSILNGIDFNVDTVQTIGAITTNGGNQIVSITSNHKSFSFGAEVVNCEDCIDQSCARWDWVYELLCQIDDQPIVIDIRKDNVRISIDY
jgi:hypothetical protein